MGRRKKVVVEPDVVVEPETEAESDDQGDVDPWEDGSELFCYVQRPLELEQMLEIHKELDKDQQHINSLEIYRKNEVARVKQEIDVANERIHENIRLLSRGEQVSIKCMMRYNWRDKLVRDVALDTGEVLSERAMTEQEYQGELQLDGIPDSDTESGDIVDSEDTDSDDEDMGCEDGGDLDPLGDDDPLKEEFDSEYQDDVDADDGEPELPWTDVDEDDAEEDGGVDSDPDDDDEGLEL